jgi:hypothetical protein
MGHDRFHGKGVADQAGFPVVFFQKGQGIFPGRK